MASKFELSTIISILDALKEEQHISLLSHQLVDLEPLEQIELLHHLSLFGAIGATQDILALLPQSTWKVQEACLQALEQLKTCHNPTEIHGYLFSPRESVRNAALKLISRMGGEAVTKFLIQLHESSQIQISESFIEAVGNTRTFQALTFLIRLLLNNTDLLPNVLSALEECLDYVPPSELQRYQDQEIDQIRLLSLCEQLLGTDDPHSRRVALKLIGNLKLHSGLPLLAQALKSDSIRTRLSAIEAAGNFHDDETVQLIADSAYHKPEDYELNKLTEYLKAALERRKGYTSDHLRSKDDLDLDRAAVKVLRQIGTLFALKQADRLIGASVESLQQIDGTGAEKVLSFPDLISVAKSIAKEVTIYSLPNDIKVWIDSMSDQKDDKDIVNAVTIHGDGTLDMAMGPREGILQDIVYTYLRGEKPKMDGPGVVKQGESKSFNWGSKSDQLKEEHEQ